MTGEGSLFDVPPAAIGRFRVLHQIGAGTCGPVFRAVAPDGDTPVAIKLITVALPPERTRRIADRLVALVDEAPRLEAAATPVDAGLHAAQPYFVTMLAPGDSLDVALKQFGPAVLPDLVPRLEVVAGVIDACAARGLVHAALHPRDVLVAETGTVLTGMGVWPLLVGEGVRLPIRRPYRAPEVADGLLDSDGDRFAFAALAYEWMTGRRVTLGAGFIDVPTLPGLDRDAVAALFERALHDDPSARFPTATAFVEALGALAGEAEPAAASSRAKRRARVAPPTLPLDGPPESAVDESEVLPLQTPVEPETRLTDWDAAETAPEKGETVLEPSAPDWALEIDPAPAPVSAPTPVRIDDAPPVTAAGYGTPTLALVLMVGLLTGVGVGYAIWGRTAVVGGGPPPGGAAIAPALPATSLEEEEIRTEPPARPVDAAPAPPGPTSATSAPPAPAPAPSSVSPPAAAPAARPAEVPPAVPVRAPAAVPRPTPPPPAVARTGSLLIESRPVGAAVQLNGRAVGVTPLTLENLSPGTYTVRLQLTGFQPLTTTVRVVAGEQARAAASLTSAQEPR